MRGLRINVLRCIDKGIRHEYAIAKSLNEHFESVRKVLKAYENMGLIEVEEIGIRGSRQYRLTALGSKALAVGGYIERESMHCPLNIDLLYSKFGREVVDIALDAGLGERVIRDKEVTLIGPDIEPQSYDIPITIRSIVSDILERGRRRAERVRLKCYCCGYVGEPGVVFPQIRGILSTLLPITSPLCPNCQRPATLVL